MRRSNPWSRPIKTWAIIDGVDWDVLVEVDYQPAEPDVNVREGIDIVSVWLEDEGCQLGNMSEQEIDELAQRLWDNSDGDDGYGDYLYDQRKDQEAEERR